MGPSVVGGPVTVLLLLVMCSRVLGLKVPPASCCGSECWQGPLLPATRCLVCSLQWPVTHMAPDKFQPWIFYLFPEYGEKREKTSPRLGSAQCIWACDPSLDIHCKWGFLASSKDMQCPGLSALPPLPTAVLSIWKTKARAKGAIEGDNKFLPFQGIGAR